MPFLEVAGYVSGKNRRGRAQRMEADAVVFFDNRRELRYCCISPDSLLVRELGLGAVERLGPLGGAVHLSERQFGNTLSKAAKTTSFMVWPREAARVLSFRCSSSLIWMVSFFSSGMVSP